MWPLSWIWWRGSPHRYGGTDFSRPTGRVLAGTGMASSRVAGKHCCFPAPSELDVRVAPCILNKGVNEESCQGNRKRQTVAPQAVIGRG